MDDIIYCLGEYARNAHSFTASSDLNFILVGHSQGGAAVGQVRNMLFILNFFSSAEVKRQSLERIYEES